MDQKAVQRLGIWQRMNLPTSSSGEDEPANKQNSLLERVVQVMAEANLQKDDMKTVEQKEIEQINLLGIKIASYLGSAGNPGFPLREVGNIYYDIFRQMPGQKEEATRVWMLNISLVIDQEGLILGHEKLKARVFGKFKSIYKPWEPSQHDTAEILERLYEIATSLDRYHTGHENRIKERKLLVEKAGQRT